jgi:hypothetical protein
LAGTARDETGQPFIMAGPGGVGSLAKRHACI